MDFEIGTVNCSVPSATMLAARRQRSHIGKNTSTVLSVFTSQTVALLLVPNTYTLHIVPNTYSLDLPLMKEVPFLDE